MPCKGRPINHRRVIIAYALLVGLPVLVLFAVLQTGLGLTAGVGAVTPAARGIAPPAPLHVEILILQLVLVLAVSRCTGLLFRRLRQPQVIGEMVAGIALGPSLFGWAAPALSQTIFPAASLGYLNALSQVGLVLFMFLVGVSLNWKELKDNGHAALLTSHASIAAPFCLGAALALFLYPRVPATGAGFTSFALFTGAAMSITAFPVLARILAERNLLRSRMGTLSIACAAIDDITGWCILAGIVVLIRSGEAASAIWSMIGGAVLYLLVMLYCFQPLLTRFEVQFRREGRHTEAALSLVFVLALLSALVTEWLGIHLVFGAFLFGALMPKSPDFVEALLNRTESIAIVILLPLFFAFSGLRTNIGSVHGAMWFYALLVLLVAIAGKFGASTLAARMAGIPWRDAASLGILMNTRGLMELIVLNIGLDIGVISQPVFTIMVLMAVTTTFMTSPLLEVVYPSRLMLVEQDRRNIA